MIDILVRPQELRQTSEQLRTSAKTIGTAMRVIDQEILSLKGDKFLGYRAEAVQLHYASKRDALLRAKDLVAHFAKDLPVAAASFEQADRGGLSTTSPSVTPPTTGPISKPTPTSPTDPGAAQRIKDLIHSMNVTGNSRYLPRDGKTYCNIFVMDFCKKMGVPLPEYLDWNKDGKIDDYLDANEAISWLNGSYNKGGVQTGAQLGWKVISAEQAARYASEGKVVIAGWKNPIASNPGHLAIVRPESTTGNIKIAQAGAKNFENGSITSGFGNKLPTYFVYEPD